MILNYIIIFFTTIFSSYIFIKIFSFIFYKYKILDNPKKYKLKRKAIPYSIWIIFFIIFFIISFLFIDYNYKLLLIWIFWFIITCISFIDDLLNVNAKIRLTFQIIIWAIIWITSIKIWYISNIFGWIINLETYFINILDYTIYLIPLFFTIIWYVFVFNALNWTDWITANTSWLSIISFFILFLLWIILYNNDNYSGWIENAEFIISICIILIWILIPFWFFDIKQQVLMWDSWTMFLWFMLATLAIIAWWKIATVLVVFWIYSVDAIYVIIKRLINKKNPLNWDFTHLHHRLQKIWLTKTQVLSLVYSLSFLFWLTALFLDKTWKIIVFFIIIILVIFINKIVETIFINNKKHIWK
jgi:UDP-GlcNAc:undecaprenyl-phosphate GlcNAc-1-phosphate transferase